MPTHLNLRYAEMEDAMKGAEKLQQLATQYGVTDIFSDNGGKVVQVAVATGLDLVPGRMGADAMDRVGNTYEMKSIDMDKKANGFSTNHHLNKGTIAKFRERFFVFSFYKGIRLHEVYLVSPDDMEAIFTRWELTLATRDHINNPKVPVDFVRENGTVMYMKDVAPAWMEDKQPAATAA